MAEWRLTSQLASLALSTFSVRVTRRVRRLIVLAILAACALGLWLAKQRLAPDATLVDAGRALAGSTAVAVVAAPARVFIEVFASQSLVQFAGWAAAGVAILVALFGLIATLDVAYAEGAVRASREVQARLQRMRSGGGAIAVAVPGRPRFSLPAAPWLGGAGPVLWRQGIEALRNLRGIAFTALFAVALPLVLVVTMSSGDRSPEGQPMPVALIMILLITVFMNQHLALDFRRDLDRMAYLKSLPLPPAAVACGQILPGIAVFTLLQGLAIAVVVAVVGQPLPFPAPMLLLLVPFNWLSMALDNALFLLFPHRVAPKEAGNVQFMGRAMMVMFAKLFGLALAVGLAALVAWPVASLGSGSLLPIGLTVSVVLSIEAALMTLLLGRVFAHFDVTVDVPG